MTKGVVVSVVGLFCHPVETIRQNFFFVNLIKGGSLLPISAGCF